MKKLDRFAIYVIASFLALNNAYQMIGTDYNWVYEAWVSVAILCVVIGIGRTWLLDLNFPKGRLFTLIALIALFSCEKMEWDLGTEYIIKKDQHESIINIAPLYGGGIKGSCKFDQSAIYDLGNENQGDWNKLIGFSEDIRIHENSARISWRWNLENEQVELGYYCYVKGDTIKGHLKYVDIGEAFQFMIRDDQEKQNYVIDIFGTYKTVNHGQEFDDKKFWSYPWFGGDEVAPHDIKIVFGRYEL